MTTGVCAGDSPIGTARRAEPALPGHNAVPVISDTSLNPKSPKKSTRGSEAEVSGLRQLAMARAHDNAVDSLTRSGLPSSSSPVAVTTRKASSTSKKSPSCSARMPKAVVRRAAISMMQSTLASSMKGSIPVVGVSSTSKHVNSANSGRRMWGSHFNQSQPSPITRKPTVSGPWKVANCRTIARATSRAPSPASPTNRKARSCSATGISATVLTAAKVCRKLTAHTGSRSSAAPESATLIGVASAAGPSPTRTSKASSSAPARSHKRVDVTIACSSLGAG